MRAIVSGQILEKIVDVKEDDKGKKIGEVKKLRIYQRGVKVNLDCKVTDSTFEKYEEMEVCQLDGIAMAWHVNGKNGISFKEIGVD